MNIKFYDVYKEICGSRATTAYLPCISLEILQFLNCSNISLSLNHISVKLTELNFNYLIFKNVMLLASCVIVKACLHVFSQ